MSLAKEVLVNQVRKRNGLIVKFDSQRIVNAIYKAMQATGEGHRTEAEQVTNEVIKAINEIKTLHMTFIPTVEGIQDTVEKKLMIWLVKLTRSRFSFDQLY